MPSSNLRTRTGGQILLALISILAVLDATTEESPTAYSTTTAAAIGHTTDFTLNLTENSATTVTVQNSSINQSDVTLPVLTEPTNHSLTDSTPTSASLNETNELDSTNSTQEQVPQEPFPTLASTMTARKDLVSHGSESPIVTKTEPMTQTVQPPYSTTMPQPTRMEEFSQITAQGSITCLGLGSLRSTLRVACFDFEETSCETVDNEKKEELRSFLCEIIMNTTDCNVTIHSSEVQPKCILWVPTSKDAEMRLQDETNTANKQFASQIKWGQVSDHQTRSQKTMIALVTCGVLLAAFILAGYFLSNRESWSPGRQRLGEDPYCTETDSQGNTLVSVSAHSQDKPNSGTRENGTGQTVSPAATNGHSTKKQTVSDTEL